MLPAQGERLVDAVDEGHVVQPRLDLGDSQARVSGRVHAANRRVVHLTARIRLLGGAHLLADAQAVGDKRTGTHPTCERPVDIEEYETGGLRRHAPFCAHAASRYGA